MLALECPVLGPKRKSISGDWRSACSHKRSFVGALDVQIQAIGWLRRKLCSLDGWYGGYDLRKPGDYLGNVGVVVEMRGLGAFGDWEKAGVEIKGL